MKIKLENDFAVKFLTHVITICSQEGIKLTTLEMFPQADI